MSNAAHEPEDPLLERAREREGTVLQERWTLVRLLGLGGAAAVYEARHRNGKCAAVKVLHSVYSGDVQMRERFLREGYVANKVGHRGVVSVLDDGVDATGAAFLVMELLEGTSLEDRRLQAGGALPAQEVLSTIADVLDALRVAHDAGIVHRDLKPENLFRTNGGEIKVLDFGIARLLERSGSATATSAQTSMGTPAFMPPEQASARWNDVDGRSDLWALGATALMLSTGLFVHDGNTAMEVLAKAIMHPARPVRERAPELPRALAEIIDRALAFDKSERYPSASVMLEAVRAAERDFDAQRNEVSTSGHALPVPVAAPKTVLLAPGERPPSLPGFGDGGIQRTEIAAATSSRLPGGVRATFDAHSTQPKRPTRWVPLAVIGLFAVCALAGLTVMRSMRGSRQVSSSETASIATAREAIPAETAETPAPLEPTSTTASQAASASASPLDVPPVEPSASAVPLPSAPQGASPTPNPVHTGRRPSPSAQPPQGPGPLTEKL